jgi:TPR repeat protein
VAKQRLDTEDKRRETLRQLRLAERGEAPAQYTLGARLAQGYFVKKDLRGALYWYAQAAKLA